MKSIYTSLMLGGILGLASMTSTADATKPEIKLETLLSRAMEVAQGTNVIVDRVTLPPNTNLSRRWHPGEMFVYVITGTVLISREGEPDIVGKQGSVVDVPLKQIYAARTTQEGAHLLLFRVHETGQPVRVKVQ